jgi:two-component system CheB/CheR fusion protein
MQETEASLPYATKSAAQSFPIVGIGTSAGGLEALQHFFQGVPAKCGMAFVVIQHMDPTHQGILAELLQRGTSMPVRQIVDDMPVQSDHIYVIPPDRDLSILHGRLLLLEAVLHHGIRLPIDFFFRSLALDCREHGVGIILSGMGSDGTLGIKAIKEASGAIFVQDPADAKFDSMPRCAIATGLVDSIAPAAELAPKVLSFFAFEQKHAPVQDGVPAESDQIELDKIITLLRTQTGQDFSQYKRSTIYRRIERRMAMNELPNISSYLRYLRLNLKEGSLLFKELLIGVTQFFRDTDVWDQLKKDGIPSLLAANPSGGTLRAWIPGCSTGEEAYTLAMIFREVIAARESRAHYSLQIFATDLDGEAVQTARAGIYPQNISADVSEERLNQFFTQETGIYQVKREIRDMVIFAQQNVAMDPPFTKLDLLCCRNLLIYLESDLQRKIIPLFHHSLKPNGLLILGSAETIGESAGLFSPLPGKTRIYRRRDVTVNPELVEFPPVFSRTRAGFNTALGREVIAVPKLPDFTLLTNELLLQRFAPAAALTTDKGDIVYICGKTGKYLEPAAGRANLNLFAMAREGLSDALNAVFAKAVREQSTVTLKSVKVGTNENVQHVDLTVQPLTKPLALNGMVLVVFVDVISPVPEADGAVGTEDVGRDERMLGMSREMTQLRDELKIVRNEMQASQEELRSANEELQSSNEELQSTNEELTTSKEEMQSINEELQSVNNELTAKVEEMTQASDDMKNLLNSTAIATLFLDDQLRVRRFTTQMTSVFKLIPSDLGRPITDLTMSLDYAGLAKDVQEVLNTLVFREVSVAGEGGRWFNVRSMPYRTRDNRIDGAVITFVDITAEKCLESALQDILMEFNSNVDTNGPGSGRTGTLNALLQRAQGILDSRKMTPVVSP